MLRKLQIFIKKTNFTFYLTVNLKEGTETVQTVDNTVEENSSVFSLIRMRWLPSAGACGQ